MICCTLSAVEHSVADVSNALFDEENECPPLDDAAAVSIPDHVIRRTPTAAADEVQDSEIVQTYF